MAGVIPTKRSTSGRKQWTLHDGPRGSLKKLRNHLASEGCAESQVVLAKQLLEEQCEHDAERRECARLGVYWLIKASEQGNIEATDLLKKCLGTGHGITEHNYMDVKSCLNMTQDEKVARKAAREMFASLSNGEDYITSEQLQKRMLEIDKNDKFKEEMYEDHGEYLSNQLLRDETFSDSSEEEVDWWQRSEGPNEKLTEDNVVAAAVDYSHGQLPIVSRILCLVDPNLRALDHIPFVQRAILHPFLALKILYYKVIQFLGRKTFRSLSFLINDFELLPLLLIYAFISADNVVYFLPLLLYYISFAVMVVATFQMLQTKREFSKFRVWSGLFLTYSGGCLNAREAEIQFMRNNLRPYGHFFVALLLNLLSYPIIAEQWVFQSEITLIAFCLTFMTLLTFQVKQSSASQPDFLLLFSFAINVLAKYPYETDPVVAEGWRFLDLKVPTFASYIVGNGVEFCINFRVLFYLLIPILFFYIAQRENWGGLYKYLIPHSVTLSWFQIVILNAQGATMFGLLRGTLALVGFVLFLPLVGITTIVLPAIALTKWIITSNSMYSIAIFIAFTAVGLGISWLLAKSRYKNFGVCFQIIFSFLAIYLLLNSVISDGILLEDGYNKPKTITWDQYQNFCHEPAWETNSLAVTQLRCSKLVGVPIEWEGYIEEVKLRSTENMWKKFFDKFPEFVSNYLYCFYGDAVENDCENMPEEECLMLFNIIKSNQKCTMDRYNVHEFEISTRMQSGLWSKSAEVILIVEHYFKNFTLNLKRNDKISFRGSLANSYVLDSKNLLGGLRPHVKLEQIACLGCYNNNLTEVRTTSEKYDGYRRLLNDLYNGLKILLNVLFNPVVLFR